MTMEKASGALSVRAASDREVVMTRVFKAPRRLVFDAWTQPQHLQCWFAPQGYILPVCEIDLRVGGRYRWVMRGPDGSEVTMTGE